MDGKEYNDKKRSNIVVLTVIAIATMIIVVIGATFAYLASRADVEDSADIEAEVQGGSDAFIINAGDKINLLATQETLKFEDNLKDVTQEIYPTVTFTGSSVATKEYSVYLSISANSFEYTSGECTSKGSKADAYSTYQDCIEASYSWAKANGDARFACYTPGTPIGSDLPQASFYAEELSNCITNENFMWTSAPVAELVADFFVGEATDTCDTTTGLCVNEVRDIDSVNTDAVTCEAANHTWIGTISESGVCYTPTKSVDLTKTTSGDVIELAMNQSITSVVNSTVADHYKLVASIVNLPHNQIANNGNSFTGGIIIDTPEAD